MSINQIYSRPPGDVLLLRLQDFSTPDSVLIIIDLINAFGPSPISPTPELPVPTINEHFQYVVNSVISLWESQRKPIIFISDAHHQSDFERLNEPPHALYNTKAAELMSWVLQPDYSKHFTKRTYDGCSNHKFCKYIQSKKFSKAYIMGTSTGVCIKHTALSLLKNGIQQIYMIEEALGDIFPSRHKFYIQVFKDHPRIHIIPYPILLFHFQK
ncbi:cysteine hydrolase family protein [Promethearchaeum syntrophicum]|uniref:Cysteine hydrolase family protein n=1 Tax=Promethearchaeum syntrophicum TaxID=2594042 RepID=A0A5B9D8T9_9ARCH|nr:isochorismatase family protein [Candidatus Prometheoarchaeum syntrophicum]QEE15190.1 Isochorismatase family protein [Candidatus Prometheoarchaeum syntrophicum]